MKGQFWKWRMHGGAVTLARKFNEMKWKPDLILATDMLDLTTFLSLTRKKSNGIPTAIYFHENQLSYPWSPTDRDKQKNRDIHYGFINYSSALSADKVFFNSEFHKESFIDYLYAFLKQFPDHQELETIKKIIEKSEALYLGMDLNRFDDHFVSKGSTPLILWNHRWEYDKNPESFFRVLKKVQEEGSDFGLVILGENFSKSPTVFEKIKKELSNHIAQWGYVDSFKEYSEWLWKSDIMPVTSNQEFFGASVMEAIYCGVWPILPSRLSYPELIPIKYHSDNIYSSEDELNEKILFAIKNQEILQRSKLNAIPKQFDWKVIASEYDQRLKNIV
tara:strand:- start:753 stop:1751 length:999 start_codon:yes stop_codon:yes gene_type:complete